MILAKIMLYGRHAAYMARSLEPDNLPSMDMDAREDRIVLQFSTEKIGTMLSTIDDLLMNIKIAEETLSSAEER